MLLKCYECDLETFPNEILTPVFQWKELNFAGSHLTHLKLNALNATTSNRLYRLHFANNSIQHLDGDSFPASNSIVDVDLSHNRIENVIGTRTLNKMASLNYLNLSYNRLTHLDPLVFMNLTYLSALTINDNRLLDMTFTGPLKNEYAVLTLSNNPIESLAQNIVAKELELRNSSITECSIGSAVKTLLITDGILQSVDLSNATNLRFVNLSSNRLTTFEIMAPNNLNVLDLSDNRLQAINLGHGAYSLILARNNITNTLNLSLPSSLEYLVLAHNKIANLEPNTFRNLTVLSYLNLAHCDLHTLDPELFIPHHMFQLDLSYNRFASIDLKQFNGLKELVQVNLNGNRLTDINVEDLRNTTQLGISNNPWNCERLQIIVDRLSRRNGIVFFEPSKEHCVLNINGIACETDNNPADFTANSTSNHGERFWDTEYRMCMKLQAAKHDFTSNVHEINHEFHHILMDIKRQRILMNPENYTVLRSDVQFRTNLNQTIIDRFRNIFERLREITYGFLVEPIVGIPETSSFIGGIANNGTEKLNSTLSDQK